MIKNWFGLIKIDKIWIEDINKNILWEKHNILNTLHSEGQEFILSSIFSDPSLIPNSYYFGLDNRGTIAEINNIDSLEDEPSTNGYQRQSVLSTGQFLINNLSGTYKAISPILTFSSNNSGGWGPVKNLFMTNKSDDSGILIATVNTGTTIILDSNQSINIKMSLSLSDC